MNKNDKTTAYDSDAPLWYGITKFERATSAEVERHIPIVRKMIELYGYGDALSYDEKFAAGLVGVAIAIERFDASRGVKYAYWLSYQIDKAIRNESRLVRRQRRRAVQPFDEDFDPIDERDWEERATRDDREERNARIDRVCAALKSLDERSQFVLSELHIEGKTQTEVARELGVSQSRTSRIARDARARIRREVEERGETIERTMKRIGVAYVSYYNKKYERIGPLFQGRFRSEPVDDAGYFIKLLAYIHLNPVKAGIVAAPGDYRWSSWNEYMSDTIDRSSAICDFSCPFPGLDFDTLRQTMARNNELKAFIPFGDAGRRLTGGEAMQAAAQVLPDDVAVSEVVSLPRHQRVGIVQGMRRLGLSFNQISRLTGVSASTVRRYVEGDNEGAEG